MQKFDAIEPEHDRMSTTFFVGNDGSLQRHDQTSLIFRFEPSNIPTMSLCAFLE